MTSSLLPWKRFDDKFDLGESVRNVSTFRRLKNLLDPTKYNYEIRQTNGGVRRQIDLQWKNQHEMSLRAESHRKFPSEHKKFDITTKNCSPEDENRPVIE